MNIESLQQFVDHTDGRLEALRLLNYQPFANDLANISTQFREFKQGAQQLLAEGETLQIGIVGQVKAGKSSFLNALFFNGEHVLPRASTPMTAGLTILEYGEQNTFEVEYFAKDDWQHFEEQYRVYKCIEEECRKEVEAQPDAQPDASPHILQQKIVENTTESDRSAAEMVEACGSTARAKIGSANEVVPFESIANLQEVLERYVGANGAYTSVVKSLHVKLKDERLRGIRIVDTPGVNDPVLSRENRTRTFLYACHGVFLLSASSDFFGSQDIQFLNTRVGEQGIAKVVLLASKFDSTLQDVAAEWVRDKNKRPLTLEEAAEQQQRKFLKRLDSLKPDIVKRLRDDLVLSYTSGISYALAHKAESTWDDIEKHVAERMKYLYPANFATPEQARDSYIALANIEDIYNDYLDGVFKQNKEAIISAKINAFMADNVKALQKQVNQVGDLVAQKYKDLKEKDVAAVEKQIEAQEELFEKIQDRIKTHVANFNSGLQTTMRTLGNSIKWSHTLSLPTEKKTGSFTRQRSGVTGWFDSTKSEDVTYKVIDAMALTNRLETAITDYMERWATGWEAQFKGLEDVFAKEAHDTIAEAAKKLATTGAFDDDFYRIIVDKSLAETKLSRVLDLGPTRDALLERVSGILAGVKPPIGDTSGLTEDNLASTVRKKAEDHMENIGGQFRSLLADVPKTIRYATEAEIKVATGKIEAMKDEFATHVQQNSEGYLQTLKAELQNKTESVRACESFKQAYEELAKIIENQRP